MLCPHCHQEHPDTARFCPVTGQEILLPTSFCPNCGQSVQHEWVRCPHCAAILRSDLMETPPIQTSSMERSRWLVWVGIFALVAILGFGSLFWIQAQQGEGPLAGILDMSASATLPAVETTLPLTPTPEPTRTPSLTPTPPPPTASPTLTPSPTATRTPSPSPTITPTPAPTLPFSGWIVYAYGEEINREIYSINPATGEQRQLTSNTFMDEAPSFSPDNSQIVFASFRNPDGWELYLYDLDTGTEQQLTHFEGQARFPQWSSLLGDDRIVFEGREGNTDVIRNIWMVHANSGEMERLTNGNADARPGWSPDGNQVVFGRALSDTTGDGKVTTADSLDIFVIEPVTSQETRVTNTPGNDDFQYTWSPDGQWIAIASVRGDTNGDGFKNLDDSEDLYLIHPDGSGEQHLDLGGKNVFSPDWSPDGNKLVMTVSVSSGRSEIWIYELASSNLIRLAGPGPFYHAEFSK